MALLYAANMSFPVLVFTKFFRCISASLIESARIDGARERRVFVRIAVYSYVVNFLANLHLVIAAVVVALLPVIIIFFRFSDQIVAGLTGGAVKEQKFQK